MAVPFNSSLAWRLWDARRMAQAMPDPAVWLARIDEIERLTDQNGPGAEELIGLLLQYKHAEQEMVARQVEAIETGATPPEQPLPILLSELVVSAHHALVFLGPAARESLLCAYNAAQPGSYRRYWFALPLADMGDPQLEPFFRELTEADFPADPPTLVAGLRARYEAARAGRGRGDDIPMSVGATEVDQMVSALAHENRFVRLRAAEALGRHGDPRAVKPLKKLLKDPDETVRSVARTALEHLGAKTERDRSMRFAG
jgi:HEAT repeat protein